MKRLLALLVLPCATMAFAQFNPTGGPGFGGSGGISGPGGGFGGPGGISGPGGGFGGLGGISGPSTGSRPITTTSRTRSVSPRIGPGGWKTPSIARGQWTHRRYAQPYTANPWILQNQRRFMYVAPTRGKTINLR